MNDKEPVVQQGKRVDDTSDLDKLLGLVQQREKEETVFSDPKSALLHGNMSVTALYGDVDCMNPVQDDRSQGFGPAADRQLRENYKGKCVCCFLAVIMILFIVMIFLKYKGITSRMTGKDQLIYFGRPNCPYCKDFDPVWQEFVEKAKASGMKGEFRKVNCSDPVESALCVNERNHGLTSVPHIVKIGASGQRHVFKENRTVEKLLEFADKRQSFHYM